MSCTDTDEACWEQCDTSCNVETECPDAAPGGPTTPGDSAACDTAYECSDACGAQMPCSDTDEACWERCDDMCRVEEACAGTDPTGPGGPSDPSAPATCDEAWACSDECGTQMGCGDYDDACWESCDESCGVYELCSDWGSFP